MIKSRNLRPYFGKNYKFNNFFPSGRLSRDGRVVGGRVVGTGLPSHHVRQNFAAGKRIRQQRRTRRRRSGTEIINRY